MRHADSPTLPSWPGVNPRALPRDGRAAHPVVVSKPDEHPLDWGAGRMALAGALFAASLFGAGLLLTIREVRRIA